MNKSINKKQVIFILNKIPIINFIMLRYVRRQGKEERNKEESYSLSQGQHKRKQIFATHNKKKNDKR